MNKVKISSSLDANTQPKCGDVVIPLSGEHIGVHAMICNHHCTIENHVYVGYHVRGNKIPGEFDSVQCSGGPFQNVKISNLTLIGTKMELFLDARVVTGPNRYDKYEEEVNVWLDATETTNSNELGRSYRTYQDLLNGEKELHQLYTKHLANCDDIKPKANDRPLNGRHVLRGSHQVCNDRLQFHEDFIAKIMFTSYKSNRKIGLRKRNASEDVKYLYENLQLGLVLKDDEELNALLEAYSITETSYDEEISYLFITPNIDISTWADLEVKRD